MTRQTLHVRMPQRADAVEGIRQQPGKAAPAISTPDPRTASQDPTRKAENAVLAKLDRGPLGA
jgi:hypothetical protein